MNKTKQNRADTEMVQIMESQPELQKGREITSIYRQNSLNKITTNCYYSDFFVVQIHLPSDSFHLLPFHPFDSCHLPFPSGFSVVVAFPFHGFHPLPFLHPFLPYPSGFFVEVVAFHQILLPFPFQLPWDSFLVVVPFPDPSDSSPFVAVVCSFPFVPFLPFDPFLPFHLPFDSFPSDPLVV